MRIWLDLTNSPHVNSFAGMIRELEKNHDLLLTCQSLASTIDFLEMNQFEYGAVGKRYGLLAKGLQTYELILDVLLRQPFAAATMGR